MRAFFYGLYPNTQRSEAVMSQWKSLKGEIAPMMDRSVRFVFTDSPRPWYEPAWKAIWAQSKAAEGTFYMVAAQWIFSLTGPLTPTTIPVCVIPPVYDKVIQIPIRCTTQEKQQQQQQEKQETTISCQYGECQQKIHKSAYDHHLLEHLRIDAVGEPPLWRNMLFDKTVK